SRFARSSGGRVSAKAGCILSPCQFGNSYDTFGKRGAQVASPRRMYYPSLKRKRGRPRLRFRLGKSRQTMPSVFGLDIGGANLRAAHGSGAAGTQPFALWRDPAGLAPSLRRRTETLPAGDIWAVTMTGELCDCFETKRQGVAFILDAVES